MKKEELIIGRKYKITKPEELTPLVGCDWVEEGMDDLDGRTFTLTQGVYDYNHIQCSGWSVFSEIPELHTTWSVCLSWLTLVEDEADAGEDNTPKYFLHCIKDGYMDGSKLPEDMFCKKGNVYPVDHCTEIKKGEDVRFKSECEENHYFYLFEDNFDEDFILKDLEGNVYTYEEGYVSKNNQVDTKDKQHNHYFKDCPYDKVDIYRIIELFDITDPCLQHAFKKIACTGKRGHKDIHKDVQDIIDTLNRWKEMRGEEANV